MADIVRSMNKHRQSIMTAFPARLTDAEWAVLEPLIPANRPGGRPLKRTRRSVLDAIVYVVRQGLTWRASPADLPNWNTAFWYFQEWQKDGTWVKVEDALRRKVRLAEGRAHDASSAGVVDSHTVKATEQPGPRGFDGGERATGVKRHAVVDTTGLVWGLAVTPANVADCRRAHAAVREARAAGGGRGVPRAARLLLGAVRHDGRGGDPPRGGGGVRGAAAAVDGRADVRVARAVAAVEQKLRAHVGE